MLEDNYVGLIIIALALMLAFALAVIWFFTYAQKKIIGTKLLQKQKEIEFQKELLSNTVKIQENERERISKELHDDIGLKLNIAILNLQVLKKMDASKSDDPIFMRIEESIHESANRTRTISHELLPPVLKNFGLVYALEDLQSSINAGENVKMEIEGAENIKIKDNMKILHIFRIIQELLSNTLKYAHATKIKITFSEEKEDLIFSYQDNGLGFDEKSTSHGLGLSNIKTRCELLNGQMNMNTKVGKGFFVSFKILNHD